MKDVGVGRGYIRLTSDSQRAFTVLTSVQELKGFPERSLRNRDGELHVQAPTGSTGAVADKPMNPATGLVIGAGIQD